MSVRRNHKETAWKKSRKFGDVKGGRRWPKIVDKVFNRMHSLLPPVQGEKTPLFITENPSRDFYFPIDESDVRKVLEKLPAEHVQELTHFWFRKTTSKDYYSLKTPQGMFLTGSNVRIIMLYPIPKDLKMALGTEKPSQKTLNWYLPFGARLINENNSYFLEWTKEGIRRYYQESLLLHEIGHLVDSLYTRFWSKSYKNKAENFANEYAYSWGIKIREEVNRE